MHVAMKNIVINTKALLSLERGFLVILITGTECEIGFQFHSKAPKDEIEKLILLNCSAPADLID